MTDEVNRIEKFGVGKTIFNNSLWLISGELLSKIVAFFFTIFVARKLGVADFGRYGFALSFVMLFSLFIDFGLTTLIVREISRERELTSKYVSNVIIIRLILSLIFFIIIFLALNILGYSKEIRVLIYLLWGWISIIQLSQVFRGVFKARERMEYEGFLNFFHNLLRFILAVVFLTAGFGLCGIGMSMLVASILTLVVSITIFSRSFEQLSWQVNPRAWLPFVKDAFPLALTVMFLAYFGRIDNIFISYLKGDEAVGVYNASLTLVWTLIFIPGFITHAAFPKLSQYAFQDGSGFEDLVAYNLKVNLLISTLLALGIFLLSSPIISLIYGNRYSQSLPVLQILIWSYPAHASIGVFVYAMNAKNKQKINSLIAGAVLLLNILLDIILIPRYSYIGAAVATLISILLLSLSLFIYCTIKEYIRPKALKPRYRDFQMLRAIVAQGKAGDKGFLD
jgi:O-antigen/teichoic acid export membrane protein